MFYGLRVNWALARLGCRPRIFTSAHRELMQKAGIASRRSPQEVALCMVAELPIVHRAEANSAVVESWIRNGKIDPAKDEVGAALIAVGLFELVTRAPEGRDADKH